MKTNYVTLKKIIYLRIFSKLSIDLMQDKLDKSDNSKYWDIVKLVKITAKNLWNYYSYKKNELKKYIIKIR